MRLDHLERYDKSTCLEILRTTPIEDLWDQLLLLQTELFFDHDIGRIEQTNWWQQSKSVLELGSGNGAYLSRLSKEFDEKKYVGIEKERQRVEIVKQRYGSLGLEIKEGDVEVKNEQYVNQFDVVLCRLLLQHLKHPRLALEYAHSYLKDNGYIFIIDSFDPARKNSRPFPYLEEAIKSNKLNDGELKSNRKITIEILKELVEEKGKLANLYNVEFTNIGENGDVYWAPRYKGEKARVSWFNLVLLHAQILRTSGSSIDMLRIYEEWRMFLEDEESWIQQGVHYLVLKKI